MVPAVYLPPPPTDVAQNIPEVGVSSVPDWCCCVQNESPAEGRALLSAWVYFSSGVKRIRHAERCLLPGRRLVRTRKFAMALKLNGQSSV